MNGNLRVRREALTAAVYIAPSLIMLLVFSVLPIVASVFMSFTKYNVLSAPEWIGLKNYINMAQDKTIAASIKNTMVYVVVTVPLQTIAAVLLAAVIAAYFRNRFGNFVKASLFIPSVISIAIIAVVWKMLCNKKGPINMLLLSAGLSSVPWLGDKTITMLLICFLRVWANAGYFLVIIYAGIMDIPGDLYESAQIDGATTFQQFIAITLPNLKNVLYLSSVLGIIWAFQEFDLVKIVSNGGPGVSTMMLGVASYRAAFKEMRMGYACAVSILMFACILVVTAVQKILTREKE